MGAADGGRPPSAVPLRAQREAIRREHKLRIHYTDAAGEASERLIWPIALAFCEGARVLAAWCELRGDFRHFRADRIASLESLGQRYPRLRRELVDRWREQLACGRRSPATRC